MFCGFIAIHLGAKDKKGEQPAKIRLYSIASSAVGDDQTSKTVSLCGFLRFNCLWRTILKCVNMFEYGPITSNNQHNLFHIISFYFHFDVRYFCMHSAGAGSFDIFCCVVDPVGSS